MGAVMVVASAARAACGARTGRAWRVATRPAGNRFQSRDAAWSFRAQRPRPPTSPDDTRASSPEGAPATSRPFGATSRRCWPTGSSRMANFTRRAPGRARRRAPTPGHLLRARRHVVASRGVAVDEGRAAAGADEGGHREPRRGPGPPRQSHHHAAGCRRRRAPEARRPEDLDVNAIEAVPCVELAADEVRAADGDVAGVARRVQLGLGPGQQGRRRALAQGQDVAQPTRLHPLPEHVRAPVFEYFAGPAGVAPAGALRARRQRCLPSTILRIDTARPWDATRRAA